LLGSLCVFVRFSCEKSFFPCYINFPEVFFETNGLRPDIASKLLAIKAKLICNGVGLDPCLFER